MIKQLELFPELAMKLTSALDELSLDYIKQHYYPEFSEEDARQAYKDGASMVFGELIDLLKKYTDLHEF